VRYPPSARLRWKRHQNKQANRSGVNKGERFLNRIPPNYAKLNNHKDLVGTRANGGMALQVLTAWGRAGGRLQAACLISLEREFMNNLLMRLWKEEEGQDLTEYALLLVLLSLAAVATLNTLAGAIKNVFSNAAANLNTNT
jgi:pilus assembly protein Flp/PilA